MKKYILIFVVVIFALGTSQALADADFTFIKVTCDLKSNTATIQAFDLYNEEGQKKAKEHEKNVYYLHDIAGAVDDYDQPLRGEIQACSLKEGQTVSFVANENMVHPARNGLRLYLNEQQLPKRFSLAYGGWTLDIQLLSGAGDFKLHQCNSAPPDGDGKCASWFSYAQDRADHLSKKIKNNN